MSKKLNHLLYKLEPIANQAYLAVADLTSRPTPSRRLSVGGEWRGLSQAVSVILTVESGINSGQDAEALCGLRELRTTGWGSPLRQNEAM